MNILLTCAGRRNYIVDYFREALAGTDGKIYAANSTPDSTALISADKGFVVPTVYDPGYIDALIRICRSCGIQAIIPLFDMELPVLADAAQRFLLSGVYPIVSSSKVISICNDKWRTSEFLVQNDVSTPRSFLNLDEALIALETGEISYPLIIKPRWGMGSIGEVPKA